MDGIIPTSLTSIAKPHIKITNLRIKNAKSNSNLPAGSPLAHPLLIASLSSPIRYNNNFTMFRRE
jgi:hypothetical protein